MGRCDAVFTRKVRVDAVLLNPVRAACVVGGLGAVQFALDFVAAFADAGRAHDTHANTAETADILGPLFGTDVEHALAMFTGRCIELGLLAGFPVGKYGVALRF